MTAPLSPLSPKPSTTSSLPINTMKSSRSSSNNNINKHNPPPLPSTLSSRCHSSIDPQTGCCKLHPQVKLCELVQGGTRWVVRRKICYKCGSGRSAGGKHHKPGVCVSTKRMSCGDVPSSIGIDGVGVGGGSSTEVGGVGGGVVGRGRRSSRDLLAGEVAGSSGGKERVASRRGSSLSHAKGVGTSGSRRSSSQARSVSRERVLTQSKDVLTSMRASSSVRNARRASSSVIERSHHHREEHVHHSAPVTPNPMGTTAEEEDFNDSDPIIEIPVFINPAGEVDLPPPPPRTVEEMHVHQERLELRRTHIREQREHKRAASAGPSHRISSKEDRKSRTTRASTREKKDDKESSDANLLSEGGRDVKPRSKRWDRHRNMSGDANNDTSGSDPVDVVPPKNNQDNITPSPAALALLESHTKKVSDRESKRRSSNALALVPVAENTAEPNPNRKMEEEQEGDDYSETSSISSSSAKMYQAEPSERNLLDGIGDFPLAGAGALMAMNPEPTFPPVNVTVDRSRSRSRPRRPKAQEDGEHGGALVPYDPPEDPAPPPAESKHASRREKSHHRRDSNRNSMKTDKSNEKDGKEGKKHDKHDKHDRHDRHHHHDKHDKHHERHVTITPTPSDKKSVLLIDDSPKRDDKKKSSSSRLNSRYNVETSTLAASTARSKRRARSRSKSDGGNLRLDLDDVFDDTHDNKSSARSRSRPTRHSEKHHSSKRSTRSVSKGRKRKEDNQVSIVIEHVDKVSSRAGGTGGGVSRSGCSKGGRSRRTTNTQPESLSSDEIQRQITIDEEEAFDNDGKNNTIKEEEEDAAPIIIYKKRAERKNKEPIEEDDDESEHTKPMALLAISSDERSHASSISSNSSDGSMYDSDEDEDEEDMDHKSRKSGHERAKEKAMMVMKDVKGGAKSIATRGKSVMGNFKGTSRKWQSALFM